MGGDLKICSLLPIGRHGGIYTLKEDLPESLKPDLTVTQELCDVCAASYKDVQRAAKVLEGQTRIVSLEPNTLDEALETIVLEGGNESNRNFTRLS